MVTSPAATSVTLTAMVLRRIGMMWSIRERVSEEKMEDGRSTMDASRSSILRLLSSILVLSLAAGCEVKQPPPPEPVSHAPLVVDPAMQHRQWPVSVAHYANGSTVAWPTGALLR